MNAKTVVDKTISVIKAICIILVVIGHCTLLSTVNNFVYKFYVALFFLDTSSAIPFTRRNYIIYFI